MGAWINLWLATESKIREKIKGLLSIAPALNFFIPQFKEIYNLLTPKLQKYFDVDGNVF